MSWAAMKAIVLFLQLLAVQGLYSSNSDVIQLTEADFKEKVLKSSSVWLVEFYAPWCGHCRNLVPDWDKAATALKGVVNVGAVDGTVAQKLASKYQIQGFPTIKVFGADKRKPTDYQGARGADAIVNAGLDAARKVVKERLSGKPSGGSSGGSRERPKPSSSGSRKDGSDVVDLNESNFQSAVLDSQDMWLVEFYAPWCGHCKKLAPEWESAATKLKGTVKLGAVDATVEQSLGSQYGVRGYPTIKLFPPGPKTFSSAQDYNGPRQASGIVDFALDALEKAGGSTVEVKQLTSQGQFNEACGGAVICVIAALPHIVESGKQGREDYLDVLTAAAKKLRRSPVRIFWSEGGSQPGLESALELTFGFPAVAALSKDKNVFATLRGAFTVDGIDKFVLALTTGGEVPKPLGEGGVKISRVQEWDGKDAEVVQEEEFSLDEILGQEL